MEYRSKSKADRVIDILPLGKGKKHYWGQKGKDYGYFTSEDQAIPFQHHTIRYIAPRSKTQATNYQQPVKYQNQHSSSLLELQGRRYSLPNAKQIEEENTSPTKSNKNLSIEKNIDIILPKINQNKKNKIKENPQNKKFISNKKIPLKKNSSIKFRVQRLCRLDHSNEKIVTEKKKIKSKAKLFTEQGTQFDNHQEVRLHQNNSQRIYQEQNGYLINRRRILRYTPTYCSSRDNPLCGITFTQQSN